MKNPIKKTWNPAHLVSFYETEEQHQVFKDKIGRILTGHNVGICSHDFTPLGKWSNYSQNFVFPKKSIKSIIDWKTYIAARLVRAGHCLKTTTTIAQIGSFIDDFLSESGRLYIGNEIIAQVNDEGKPLVRRCYVDLTQPGNASRPLVEYYLYKDNGDSSWQVIAYEKNRDLIRNKPSVIPALRFYSRFFGMTDSESETTLAQVKERFESDESMQIEFIRDTDKIVEVYEECEFGTCMSGPAYRFDTNRIHPMSAIGNESDIFLAVLKRKEKIVARALVNESSEFQNVYSYAADISAIFLAMLRNKGYRRGDFNGSKIKRIELAGDRVVMPYLNKSPNFDDHGDCLVLHDYGEFQGHCTSGTASLVEKCECQYCGALVNSETMVFIESQDCNVCESCLDYHFSQCDSCNEQTNNNDLIVYDNCDYGMCHSCAEDSLSDCEHCDSTFESDKLSHNDNDELICTRCSDQEKQAEKIAAIKIEIAKNYIALRLNQPRVEYCESQQSMAL